MRSSLFLFLFLLILYGPASYSRSSALDSLVLLATETGDTLAINRYLEEGIDINAFYRDAELTLMALSIEAGQTSMTELLIQKGADTEQICDRKTPMMFAAKYNRAEVVPLLLSAGADINSINRDKNSALHYAAEYGNIGLVKVLCENGASVNLRNNDNWTAMDFAIISKRKDIEEYLITLGGEIFYKSLPSFIDGPYIEILQADKLNVFYLSHDSAENKSRIISEPQDFNTPLSPISGFEWDPPASAYKDVSRILAIGDIHGQYSRMILMLKQAGVIDENLDWIWGDGHLVFTGDIFDRGNEVTDCLWLIYKLEQQAVLQQGKVHLLLGNHEVMILNGDLRYISSRYYGITGNLQLEYSWLFNPNTVLGRWLRTKNTIEKINDLIFVHAGISPQFVAKNISIDSANCVFRAFLNGNSELNPDELQTFLNGNLGPIWYRGYTNKTRYHSKINPEELQDVLSEYLAECIIVGHTENDSILSLYNSKVIDINIPLWNENIIEQALLIEENRFYRVYANGDRDLIK